MAFYDYRPTSMLYHSCSAAGFAGITSNGSIWLSDLQYANDPKELQLAEIVDRVLMEVIREEALPQVRAAYAGMKVQLQTLRQRFWMHSFSLSLQSDKLPMWQEYTDRGRGYCIGFRPSAFDHMSLRVQRVRYVQSEHLGALHTAVAEIAAPLVGRQDDIALRIGAVTSLLSLITATKEDTWQHEDEVRLIFSSMSRPSVDGKVNIPVGILRDGTEIPARDPLLRTRGDVEVPYFDMQFGRYRSGRWDPSGAIAEVIVGPNNTRTVDEVSDELRAKGYRGVKVIRSRCSFRP
ncbi:hypothetical protein FHS26_006551 [Rhizobium pisi]|nr:DUF2971 domain-containing protein [Rhizobium pisi]MBB3138772.1 hypothetical protein [Rhizobium pisi]